MHSVGNIKMCHYVRLLVGESNWFEYIAWRRLSSVIVHIELDIRRSVRGIFFLVAVHNPQLVVCSYCTKSQWHSGLSDTNNPKFPNQHKNVREPRHVPEMVAAQFLGLLWYRKDKDTLRQCSHESVHLRFVPLRSGYPRRHQIDLFILWGRILRIEQEVGSTR